MGKHIQGEVGLSRDECSSTSELQVSSGGMDVKLPICAAFPLSEFLL